MEKESKVHLAVLSGIFGTGGAILGKYAMNITAEGLVTLISKITLLTCMITSNTIGCTLFVKALAASSSSLPVTITSSSVNYFCSAIMGRLLFNEKTSIYWWCGTSLVLAGLLLICNAPAPATGTDSKRKQH